MSKTEISLQKVPDECVDTINTYGNLIAYAVANDKILQEEEMRRKLRGYLTCLVDMGKLTENDARAINLWITTGHNIARGRWMENA